MFYISKERSFKGQLEEIWKNNYKARMQKKYYDEIKPQLQLTEVTSFELEKQLEILLYEMSKKHEEIIMNRGMNTSLLKIENGDFVIAIDDEVYIG